MFETFNSLALSVQIQALLSIYSPGRTTGIVLDVGHGVTQVLPVYEGYILEQGVQRVNCCGRDVDDYLAKVQFAYKINIHETQYIQISYWPKCVPPPPLLSPSPYRF